jgi:predicted esterase
VTAPTLAEATALELIATSIEHDEIVYTNATTAAVRAELQRRANVFVREHDGGHTYCGANDAGTWIVEVPT